MPKGGEQEKHVDLDVIHNRLGTTRVKAAAVCERSASRRGAAAQYGASMCATAVPLDVERNAHDGCGD